MSLYETTRAELIERILKIPLQDWKGGVVDSGTTATVVDDERDEVDDYFQNTTPISWVRIVSTTDGAAPKGEQRKITDFTQSTGTITVSDDKLFSITPGAGDTYAILSEYTWDELAEAINAVIDSLTENALIYKIDETTELQSDTYEYAIPDGFVTIHRLSQENDDGDYPDPIPPDQYRIIRGETPRIHFYRMPIDMQFSGHYYGELWVESELSDGKHLRIEGYGKQSRLTTDDSICYLNPNYIVWKAATYVLGARITENDYDAFRVRRDNANAEAEVFLKNLSLTKFPPDTKRVYR